MGQQPADISQKIYQKPQPPKRQINWKKFFGVILIAATFTVVLVAVYPWGKYFVNKYILKREALSTVNVTGPGSGSVGYSQDIYFQIETAKVKIVAPVIEGVDEASLKKGIGHHPETPWPDDKRGNVILAGHSSDIDPNNDYGQIFRSLNQVEIGDLVSITYPATEYIYKVESRYEINPDDSSLFGQDGGPRLTFYTCSPVYTTWRRLVYIAKLEAVKTKGSR